MKARLDSSEVFRQENYKGEIKEVSLTGKVFHFQTLKESLDFAEEKKYIPIRLAIVNRVWGSPANNEPLNATFLTCKYKDNLDSVDALILQVEDDGIVGYRFCEDFRFLM